MKYTWVRITADQVVSNTPALIGGVVLTDDGVGNCSVTLHDGSSTSDPVILTVKALQHTSKSIGFQPFLETQRGLYVNVGSNVTEILIQLAIEKE